MNDESDESFKKSVLLKLRVQSFAIIRLKIFCKTKKHD